VKSHRLHVRRTLKENRGIINKKGSKDQNTTLTILAWSFLALEKGKQRNDKEAKGIKYQPRKSWIKELQWDYL